MHSYKNRGKLLLAAQTQEQKEDRDFLTLQEVADKLRVAQRGILRYIQDKKLHAIETGYWRFPKESYEKFLRDNTNFQAEVTKFRRKKEYLHF